MQANTGNETNQAMANGASTIEDKVQKKVEEM